MRFRKFLNPYKTRDSSFREYTQYMEGVMSQSNIIMYTTEDGITKVEVTFDQDTVWLSID